MKNKQIALNTHNYLRVFLLAMFVFLTIIGVCEGECLFSAFFGFLCLFPIFVLMISPMYYVFDEKAVTIVYLWGLRETILWSYITDIEERGSWLSKYSVLPYFVLSYPHKENRIFFMVGEISKTKKTTKFIRHYCGKK